jgi:putative flippase GtrA
MNPLRRWVRFNVVGVAGMLVQLVTLAGLNHIIPRHYLLNSLIAVETAILHNFVAHVHYTWRDRIVRNAWRDRRARMLLACSLWRFQVSNGAVSLVGNAALMKLLVGVVHMPVLLANLIAIVVCGVANFWVGDNWAFRARSRSGRLLCQGVALVLIVMQVGVAVGQQTAQPAPQAGTAPQQAVPVLSAAAQKIKEDVCRIPDDGKITVGCWMEWCTTVGWTRWKLSGSPCGRWTCRRLCRSGMQM